MSYYPQNTTQLRRDADYKFGTLDGKDVYAITVKPPSGMERDVLMVIDPRSRAGFREVKYVTEFSRIKSSGR